MTGLLVQTRRILQRLDRHELPLVPALVDDPEGSLAKDLVEELHVLFAQLLQLCRHGLQPHPPRALLRAAHGQGADGLDDSSLRILHRIREAPMNFLKLLFKLRHFLNLCVVAVVGRCLHFSALVVDLTSL